jgi:hypothetical protein
LPPWLLVACASLTTWRLAWLLTASDFPPVDRARRWTVKHGPGWLGELVTCHFCCSGWLALLVVALADLFASVPLPGLVWGAAWAAGPFLVELERRVSG